MENRRAALVLTGFVALATTMFPSNAPAGRVEAAPAPIDPDVLKLREAAWRAYFAGDESALGSMLPPEFIGINMADGPFVSREKALEQARTLRASGGRLVSLAFPETRSQRYGSVVILYGRYSAVVESGGPESKARTLAGRLTEVFVRQDGRWIHTGWHLDTASTP